MKILILSNYSDKIVELNVLTQPNKQRYAAKHGYELQNRNVLYTPQTHVEHLEYVRTNLSLYDGILTIGCDVLFTNLATKIEDVMAEDRIQIAREHISWWPINNDVMFWPNTAGAHSMLGRLIHDAPIWLEYPWLWQNHLWNLIQADRYIRRSVKIVEARVMNSTHQPVDSTGRRIPGPSSWQLGDWVIHFLDMPLESKIKAAMAYLPFVGDGTFVPTKESKV